MKIDYLITDNSAQPTIYVKTNELRKRHGVASHDLDENTTTYALLCHDVLEKKAVRTIQASPPG